VSLTAYRVCGQPGRPRTASFSLGLFRVPEHLGLVGPHTASFGFACDVPRRTRLWTASLPAIGNGIRAVVVHCCDRLLDVLVLTGKCAGQRHYLPRVPMSSDANALPFRLVRLSLSAYWSIGCTVPPICSHSSEEVLPTCSQTISGCSGTPWHCCLSDAIMASSGFSWGGVVLAWSAGLGSSG
jgi:hypothetical protein